jgi:hypothetical protein
MRSSLLIAAAVLVLAPAATAQTVLFDSNGFEPTGPTPYTPGNLIGQNGWDLFANTAPAPYTVQSTTVAAGAQAVQLGGGTGDATWAFPPVLGGGLGHTPLPGTFVRVQADLAKNAVVPPNGGSIFGIDVYTTTLQRVTLFGLSDDGTDVLPFVFAPFNTTTGQFDPTQPPAGVFFNIPIPANTFVSFDTELNYTTKTFRLFLDGQDLGFNIPFVTAAATNIGEADVAVFTVAGLTDVGFLDNYRVSAVTVPVPEPAALGLVVGLAGLALVARRHRRPAAA